MKIEVKEAPFKTILFWISTEEANNEHFMSSLRSRFKYIKDNKYLPVILESGTGNMEDHMYLLMKHNYEILAKRTDVDL